MKNFIFQSNVQQFEILNSKNVAERAYLPLNGYPCSRFPHSQFYFNTGNKLYYVDFVKIIKNGDNRFLVVDILEIHEYQTLFL